MIVGNVDASFGVFVLRWICCAEGGQQKLASPRRRLLSSAFLSSLQISPLRPAIHSPTLLPVQACCLPHADSCAPLAHPVVAHRSSKGPPHRSEIRRSSPRSIHPLHAALERIHTHIFPRSDAASQAQFGRRQRTTRAVGEFVSPSRGCAVGVAHGARILCALMQRHRSEMKCRHGSDDACLC